MIEGKPVYVHKAMLKIRYCTLPALLIYVFHRKALFKYHSSCVYFLLTVRFFKCLRHGGRFAQNLQASIALLCTNKLLSDKDRMMNFEPGEYMRKMIFQSVTQMARKNH